MPNNVLIPAIPSYLAKRVTEGSALSAEVSAGIKGGADVPRISIKSSRFRLIVGGAETVLEEASLNIIIVGANPSISKLWYEKEWSPDADSNEAPDCFSFDNVAPNIDSSSPQSDLCATCQWNIWGSKISPSGQKTKACADQKRLAVVAAGEPDGEIYLLQVTPAALKGLNGYQMELHHRGIPAEVVVTKVSFDSEASFPKLVFNFGGFVPENVQPIVDKLFGTNEVKRITGQIPHESHSQESSFVPTEKETEAVVVADKPVPMANKPLKVVDKPVPVEDTSVGNGFGAALPESKSLAKPGMTDKSATSLIDEVNELLGDDYDDAE